MPGHIKTIASGHRLKDRRENLFAPLGRLRPFPSMLRLARKLQGRSLDEAKVRGLQALAVLYERCGSPVAVARPRNAASVSGLPASLRDPGLLLEIFRGEMDNSPLIGLRDPAATAARAEHVDPGRAIADAEHTLRGRLSLFGARDFAFGSPIDWHWEPRAGRNLPRLHWSRIDYLDPAVAGDKKIVWELNRQQYLLTLGRAYAASGDERYAEAVVTHLGEWIAANPHKMGVNWASALEVSYRAIAWLWALALIRTSPSLEPRILLTVVKQLALHGRHIETYLSHYFSPNTHLTGEALGLYYLGTLLPFLRRSERWRSTGRSILLAQLPRQVRADGSYFENATYYHRYTLDIYVHLALLARGRGEPLDDGSLRRVERLAEALAALTRPDGTHPYIGDDDGGRLLPLDHTAPNDFSAALGNAAVLFARPDLNAVAGRASAETVWLFGEAATGRGRGDHASTPRASRALPDGGLFIMRDERDAAANFLVMDCGPHGALNCGHAHADALAFELAAKGRSLLVDPGTYSYTGSRTARDAFRSTAYHNALTVDGASSSEPAGPFNWASTAHCRLLDWASDEHHDVFEGEHDGYNRLPAPVRYRRGLLFVKNGYWILRDRAESSAPHDYALHFHFEPDAAPQLVETAGRTICREQTPGKTGLDLVTFEDDCTWALEDGWVSTRYTDRRRARVGVLRAAAPAIDAVTFMLPREADRSGPVPTEVAAQGGRAFALTLEEGGQVHDLYAIRHSEIVSCGELSSDAAWLWMRRRDSRVDYVILRGVRHAALGAQTLFRTAAPVNATLRSEGDDVVVDAGGAAAFEVASLGLPYVRHAGRRFETGNRSVLRFQDGRLADTADGR